MIYLSAEYILSAIQQLEAVHTFIGITFLTCKKHELPVGIPTEFLMDSNTKHFMTSVHKICPSSDFYFQPYQTIRGKQWLAAKYPSSGLQAINTQTFSSAFIHDRKSKLWAWTNDYVEQIKRVAIPKEEKKASIYAMAVWVLKDYKWKDTATLEDVVSRFITDYHLTNEEINSLFSCEQAFPNVPAFQNEPVSWNQLSNSLSNPPDAVPEQEGTLSKIELINVGPCDHIEMALSPRLNIVTGDNGLGKTFLMDCAWWALTNTWTGNEARPKYAEGSKRASISFAIAGKSKLSKEKRVLYDNKNLTWKRSADTATIPGLIIYLIVWAWNEHKENCKLRGIKPDSRIVVMVDELEAHLHPKWQRTILPALIEVQKYLADELEVQFIIATHSPLIMASSESVFDIDTDKLFQIRLAAETSDAVVTEENFIKYGQVNAWLTSPIFNLNQARATGAEQAINEAKTLQLEDDPSDVEVQAVHQKLLQSLAQNDPFWPRWIYFAEQHGVTL